MDNAKRNALKSASRAATKVPANHRTPRSAVDVLYGRDLLRCEQQDRLVFSHTEFSYSIPEGSQWRHYGHQHEADL